MTITEAARELGLNERTLRRAIKDGRLTAVKRGRLWDVDIADARRAVGDGALTAPYQDALAEALRLLRAVGHEEEAIDLEQQYGLVYIEPQPRVKATSRQPKDEK